MKSRSLLSIALAGVLGFGGVFSSGMSTEASKLNELQNQKSNIQSKHSEVHKSIGEKGGQISDISDRQSQLEAEMKRLEAQIADTDQKIKEKIKQIQTTKAEIEQLKAEVEELRIRIEKRNLLLQERARNIQTNGGSVNYVDVILGAESFGDFIDRVTAVTTLVNADKQIMDEQKADKKQVEANQAEVEQKLASLNGMLKELETLKSGLNVQNSKKKAIAKELAAQKQHLESEKMALEEESEILKAQSSAIEQAIKLEKKRIADEAARRAREEAARKEAARKEAARKEAARKAAEEKKQNANNSSNSSINSGNDYAGTPPVSSGLFMRPAMGYKSSGFGGRSLGQHYGIDIAASGTVPIVAAADGVVSSSYMSSSYGNVVFVVHHLNGQTYTTVYAHMRSRSVAAGTPVSKGQQLGYMGNTGHSYGQHLHFELHIGPWNSAKSNAVDPSPYIGL